MQEITREDMDILIRLQKAESEMVRIESYLKDVNKEKIALELTLTEFKTALDQHREALELTQRTCREIEAEIQMTDERIVKSNTNLRLVKTNKEYQALQREVDDNRKRKEQLETQFLQLLEDKESQEALVKEREADLKQLTAKIRADQETIDSKTVDDRAILEEYGEQREEIGRKLDKHLLTRFDEVSKNSGGLAVVEVVKEVCHGCFMGIPPQLFIEVQRCNQLIQCPQCNRILFFKDEDTVGPG